MSPWALGDGGEPAWVCVTVCLSQHVPMFQAVGAGTEKGHTELSVLITCSVHLKPLSIIFFF